MAKSSKRKLYLYIKVLQNGATLATVEKDLTNENLKLTSKGTGPLVLPFYPINNTQYLFLSCTKSTAKLIIEHGWEGFATTTGELVRITRQEKGQSSIDMVRGDYASITHNDLRIMVKITNEKPKSDKKAKSGVSKSYKGSLLGLHLTNRTERMAFGSALLVGSVLVGSFVVGLMGRKSYNPKNIAEIRPEYSLPFVHPKHFETAPEALQKNYNRLAPVRSVINYYSAVAENMVGMEIRNENLLFPTSVAKYEEMRENQAALIQSFASKQSDTRDHIKARGKTTMVAIPAVVGETMVGTMQRVIDKLDIMQEGFEFSLKARRVVSAEFPKEEEYTFDDYRNVGRGNDALKKFVDSVSAAFNPESSEDQMYLDALKLGKTAQIAQIHLKKKASSFEEPIRFLPESTFATYLSDFDFQSLDDRLKQMQGMGFASKQVAHQDKVATVKTGTIEKALVERFINQHKFQLQICYEQSLRRNDKAVGTMEWKWTINSRGVVSGVELASSTIKDKKLEKCIKEKMSTWQFPNPQNGSVEISYPFVFSPNKG